MPETYLCANCRATITREFGVRSVIRTCEECDRNGRFLHTSLVDSLESIPDSDRPDEWETMPLDERFTDALKRGLIQLTR
ncbi:hypothetical protein [Haloarcula montana]|uniref:hypothetical protein n=1 Tax=Haloarcula montana TaxID=3111776 RepID=UPI002D795DCB|nr:hypothetical protein [Haloarcula sp. GH36]